jgi:hypothetical protein
MAIAKARGTLTPWSRCRSLRTLFDYVARGDGLIATSSSYPTSNDPKFYEDTKHEPLTTAQGKSISEVFARSWFQRLWVVRELALAQEAGVPCSNYVLPWDCLLHLSYYPWKMEWRQSVRFMLPRGPPMVSLGFEMAFRIRRLIFR